ncbi:hypothetical protein PSE10B_52520 [Pseudomonas amygdali pv. eriobotryae]|nr:hypothetical protein PSE10B_52520 [Pseudomonas amygdali pv. eriobotryae]
MFSPPKVFLRDRINAQRTLALIYPLKKLPQRTNLVIGRKAAPPADKVIGQTVIEPFHKLYPLPQRIT